MSSPFERIPPPHGTGPRFGESHLARVTSVQDPDSLGRVQIELLSFQGPTDDSTKLWARVAVGVAGTERGTFLLPDIGDEVLVTFIGGDPRRPVVVGSLWNGEDRPTEDLSQDRVDVWSFTSRDGTVVKLDETTSNQARFTVTMPDGTSALLTAAEGGKIELTAAGSTVTLDPSGVSIDTRGKVTVDASQIEMSAGLVQVDAAMSTFSGTVKCSTLIATSVVGTTYTPGAGNIW